MNWGDRHDRCAFCPQTIVDSCRAAVNEGGPVRCEWPLERRLKRGARQREQTQDGTPLLLGGGTDAGLRVQVGTGSKGRTQE